MSYLIISHQILSYHIDLIISYRILYLTISYQILSYHIDLIGSDLITSHHNIPYSMSSDLVSFPII